MIELYYWPTPNGHKITIFLEECGLKYGIKPVNITKGEQFTEDFLKISPNNRMPAIIDFNTKDNRPLAIFESGAILLYLADKTKQFLPQEDIHARYKVLQWLFWQVGGLGPMAGQNHHFSHYAPQRIDYAIERYVKETTRLYSVLNKQLEGREYIANEYSIADMASYPWIVPYENQGQKLDNYPYLKQWFHRMQARPAVQRAYEQANNIQTDKELSEEAKRILFNLGK
ncbi:glutathione binding-like protein [Legionella sp. km772]|uniref:glutathione S-transferase N-terminal domain-containing protein n=1 Tax=Legionella sp. km772 TaxID=2498111 RepID=UPI000F8DA46B|nr:glutathione binding-like protein [Legionella sp. km772]RUR07529.1 thiol:disulfide oxidoreductase [Legionella sp. km772]